MWKKVKFEIWNHGQYLKSLSESKATGTDEIPSMLLKIACNSIVTPIIHIINRSIISSVYPDKWKSARISPIFKNGDGSDVDNYRRISILPVILRLLERSVFDQLYPFLNVAWSVTVSCSDLLENDINCVY